MIKKQIFYVNQNLQLSVPGSEKAYRTSVQDLSSHIIYVIAPVSQGKVAAPETGTVLEGSFYEGDSMFSFETSVLGIKTEDNIPLLMLKKPYSVTRVIRRNYYRRPAILSIKFSYGMEAVTGKWTDAKTIDIGGGGIRFATGVKLDMDCPVNIRIFPDSGKKDEQKFISAAGRVVRIEASPAGTGKYLYSVNFTDIRESERDRLINLIFSLERKRIL